MILHVDPNEEKSWRKSSHLSEGLGNYYHVVLQ